VAASFHELAISLRAQRARFAGTFDHPLGPGTFLRWLPRDRWGRIPLPDAHPRLLDFPTNPRRFRSAASLSWPGKPHCRALNCCGTSLGFAPRQGGGAPGRTPQLRIAGAAFQLVRYFGRSSRHPASDRVCWNAPQRPIQVFSRRNRRAVPFRSRCRPARAANSRHARVRDPPLPRRKSFDVLNSRRGNAAFRSRTRAPLRCEVPVGKSYRGGVWEEESPPPNSISEPRNVPGPSRVIEMMSG